ncbi:MAG: hypothetical protein M3O94_05400, partial [Actinomycetota bacterium]|nr:hypothetical protein [Actinomycetota bacterium]
MVTDETRKYRDLISYALLGVGALYFIGALSLLFKSTGGAGFATKSAFVGTYFEAPVPVVCLVVAVLLVTRFGELSTNARIVVLAALGIGGLDLLFAVITFFAQFGADAGFGFAGVGPAGKVVGVILGLAQLTFLGAACFFFYTAFQSLPAPAVAAPQPWVGDGGFAQYGAPTQQAWGQPDQSYPQQGYPQQGYPQQGPSQGWATPGESQPPAWGQAPSAPAAPTAPAAPAGPAAPPPASSWAQPAPTGWTQQQPQQYGSPAAPVPPQHVSEPTTQTPVWGQPEQSQAPAGDAPAPEPPAPEPPAPEPPAPEPPAPEPPAPEPPVTPSPVTGAE